MESNHPQQIKNKKSIHLAFFFISPSVRSLTSVDYCANRLAQNITVSAAGISPKRVPTAASYLAPIKPPGMQLEPENQTDSKRCLFHPAKNPIKPAQSFVYYNDVKR